MSKKKRKNYSSRFVRSFSNMAAFFAMGHLYLQDLLELDQQDILCSFYRVRIFFKLFWIALVNFMCFKLKSHGKMLSFFSNI
jgi:hypothetical protein